MKRNTTVGIDVGTYQIKIAVAELGKNEDYAPRIIGTGLAESKGLRHGYIINSEDITKGILSASRQAEKASGIAIKKAFISVGGIGLSGTTVSGNIVISRADSEISGLEIAKVQEACEKEVPASFLLNRKIIHAVPLSYKLDGKTVLGNPIGLKGIKLEAKMLIISCLERHLSDLIEAIEEAGIEVIDVMASPLAASLVTLSKTQKIAGCVLANIGAETVSIVVFENNIPISLEVFPTGSTDITNDLALGLKIPIEEAEHIKIGGVTIATYPKKKMEEIISARLEDIFELIEAHLKKIGRDGLLPAGIVITGGGGEIGSIADLAKSSLELPSRIASINFGEAASFAASRDAMWSVAYGLCIFGFTAKNDPLTLQNIAKIVKDRILGLFKQFLP